MYIVIVLFPSFFFSPSFLPSHLSSPPFFFFRIVETHIRGSHFRLSCPLLTTLRAFCILYRERVLAPPPSSLVDTRHFTNNTRKKSQFAKLSLYFGNGKSVCLSVCPQSQGNFSPRKIWPQTAPDVHVYTARIDSGRTCKRAVWANFRIQRGPAC